MFCTRMKGVQYYCLAHLGRERSRLLASIISLVLIFILSWREMEQMGAFQLLEYDVFKPYLQSRAMSKKLGIDYFQGLNSNKGLPIQDCALVFSTMRTPPKGR